MRQFASTGFRIWNLSREAKLVYSFFGLFSLLALGVSALFYEDLVGTSLDGVRDYYVGEGAGQASPRAAGGSPTRGPAIEVAGDEPSPVAVRPLVVAVTYRKLLEVTHFHLFTVPVFLLIIAHLFMLTGLSASAKMAWIAGGWLSALLHLAAPWLLRYGGSGFAWTYPVSGCALGVTSTVLTVYPTWAMWTGRPPRSERVPAEA